MFISLLFAGVLAAAQFPNAGPPRKGDVAKQQQYVAAPDPQMKRVLEKLAALEPKPLAKLNPAEARQQPTMAEAVKEVLREQNMPLDPLPVRNVEDREVELTDHSLDARIYTPRGQGPFPVIVYYHGGGWVIADLDTYDATARALCRTSNAIVVSVHYRQAPEHKFPAAHEDAYGAYQWVLQNATSFKGDPTRIAVAGESAGGNLAAAVCLMAKEGGVQLPIHQVLVYPIAASGMDTPSYKTHANAKPLNAAGMKWFFEQYLKGPEDYQNPAIALVQAKDLSGLPPATIINAEIDPLLSEGEQYAEQLKKAGVSVVQRTFSGVTHEFFGMGAVLDKANEAQELVAEQLRNAFDKSES